MNQSEQQESLQRILATDEGKRLLRLLSGDGGKALRSAGSALEQGDTREVRNIMAPLMKDPEVRQLLKALEQSMEHG